MSDELFGQQSGALNAAVLYAFLPLEVFLRMYIFMLRVVLVICFFRNPTLQRQKYLGRELKQVYWEIMFGWIKARKARLMARRKNEKLPTARLAYIYADILSEIAA